MPKKSFFEKLTGAISVAEDFEEERITQVRAETFSEPTMPQGVTATQDDDPNAWMEEESNEGQLAVDVFQTNNEIIIKTMVAGVSPDDLDISITRDMVIIKGKREESRSIAEDNYFHRELYWGTFSRTILLPAEVDVEACEANADHGLLIIRLPKIDKERQTRLKVKRGG